MSRHERYRKLGRKCNWISVTLFFDYPIYNILFFKNFQSASNPNWEWHAKFLFRLSNCFCRAFSWKLVDLRSKYLISTRKGWYLVANGSRPHDKNRGDALNLAEFLDSWGDFGGDRWIWTTDPSIMRIAIVLFNLACTILFRRFTKSSLLCSLARITKKPISL